MNIPIIATPQQFKIIIKTIFCFKHPYSSYTRRACSIVIKTNEVSTILITCGPLTHNFIAKTIETSTITMIAAIYSAHFIFTK